MGHTTDTLDDNSARSFVVRGRRRSWSTSSVRGRLLSASRLSVALKFRDNVSPRYLCEKWIAKGE